MAREQLANNAATTLNGSIDNSQTTLTLTSATGFPAAPFRAIVDSEIMLVGARSGTACSSITRGVEGTSAASHADLATITHVLTVAGLLDATGGEYAQKYNPDHETPATAVADQEEFNTSTGMAWTGAPATDDLSTYPGFYRFKGDTTERHLSKAWTPGATDITIAAKFSISRGATDTGGPGLYVGDTTGNPANGVYVFFVPTSATNGFKLFNENGAGTFAELGTSQAIPNLQPWQSVYLRLTRAITGPVWTAYFSRDGVTWFVHPTTGSKALTIAAFGFRMDNNHDISLDWIRVWTSIVSKVGA